jgi:thiamine pyrophosphokinase
MIVLICSGGPADELCSLERFLNCDDVLIIGADKGAETLFDRGIIPNVMIGDFDSINQAKMEILQKQVKEIIYANVEKDETDTDLALNYAVNLSPSKIILTGVSGGRLDHEEAAKRSLLRVQLDNPTIPCILENRNNRLQFLIEPNKEIRISKEYRYISFFAYSENIEGVTLHGVKYETENVPMPLMSSMFTSNEIVSADCSILFTNGICLMITSAD